MLGDNSLDDADLPDFASRSGLIIRLIASPPALAVASLVIAMAALMTMAAATEIGDVYVNTAKHATTNAFFRLASGVRLGVSLIAMLLAVVAAMRQIPDPLSSYLQSEDDVDADLSAIPAGSVDEVAQWIRTLIGAALVVALLAVVVNGAAFFYALATHSSQTPGFA
jgi:hypothetical protein